MGIKSFTKLFVTEDEKPASAPAPVPSIVPPPMPSALQVAPQMVVPQQADPAMLKNILDDVLAEAPKGYTEFLGHLSTLADALPTESLLYAAAIKLAVKQGNSLEGLTLDFQRALKILEEHGNQFDAAAKEQVANKVGSREAKVTQLKAEMAALQEQIAQISSQISTESQAIAEDTATIESTRRNFGLAFQVAHDQISTQQLKLTQYGKK